MPGCAAINCSNSAKKGFLMKYFPRNPLRRKEWLARMKRDNWYPTNYSCLCEVHFTPEMWEKTRVDGRRKLKSSAVPTIFSFKQPKGKRKTLLKCYSGFVELETSDNNIMVNKCCVPGCKSNYASTLKKYQRYVSIFRFPRNEELKQAWLEAISRTDYTPSIHSGVCEFHFDEDDILKYENVLQSDGTILPELVRRPQLKKNTVPKLFVHHNEDEKIVNNQYHRVKDEVKGSAHGVQDEEDQENFETKKGMFEDWDFLKNSIKKEIIDDIDESLVKIENEESNYQAELIDEVKFSSMVKTEGGHAERKRHNCAMCGEVFFEAIDLQAHVEVHIRGNEYRCLVCGEAFTDEKACALHVQEHKEELFYYSKCSETLSTKTEVKDHFSTHENEDFPVSMSDLKLANRQIAKNRDIADGSPKNSQQIHIIKHTDEPPYKCSLCHKAFSNRGSLRRHVMVHNGEKPHVCAICRKDFNRKFSLRKHIKLSHSAPNPEDRHSGTPYYCPLCTDMFATSQELIEHLIVHCDIMKI